MCAPFFAAFMWVWTAPAQTQDPSVAEDTTSQDAVSDDSATIPQGEQEDGTLPVAPHTPVVQPDGADVVGRDSSAMPTDAGHSASPGADDNMPDDGSQQAVIRASRSFSDPEPPEGQPRLPEGVNIPTATESQAAGWTLTPTGFVHADFVGAFVEGAPFRSTFVPREVELNLVATWDREVELRLDLNIITEPAWLDTNSPGRGALLADRLIEQAYAQWSPWRFTLRAGKMNPTFGAERLDVVDRLTLSRSAVSRHATPDDLTGVLVQGKILRQLDVQVGGFNGWNLTLDNNRSKTFLVAMPHRLGEQVGGRWLYEGTLVLLMGAERAFTNDVRTLVDYTGRVYATPELSLAVELLMGWEQGLGRTAAGMIDPDKQGQWYGGQFFVEYDGWEPVILPGKLRAVARVEYIYDPDLVIPLPRLAVASPMSTYLGGAVALRYQIIPGLELGAEYSAVFQKSDVANVSVHRDLPLSRFYEWFRTQTITISMIGAF